MRSKYATVKIPEELARKLDEYAADLGYRSRAEIVNDAIRRFIDERKKLNVSSAADRSKTESNEVKPKPIQITR
jgi:metal-responsive CopG/Arc/MetJ family transcriptional regulator